MSHDETVLTSLRKFLKKRIAHYTLGVLDVRIDNVVAYGRMVHVSGQLGELPLIGSMQWPKKVSFEDGSAKEKLVAYLLDKTWMSAAWRKLPESDEASRRDSCAQALAHAKSMFEAGNLDAAKLSMSDAIVFNLDKNNDEVITWQHWLYRLTVYVEAEAAETMDAFAEVERVVEAVEVRDGGHWGFVQGSPYPLLGDVDWVVGSTYLTHGRFAEEGLSVRWAHSTKTPRIEEVKDLPELMPLLAEYVEYIPGGHDAYLEEVFSRGDSVVMCLGTCGDPVQITVFGFAGRAMDEAAVEELGEALLDQYFGTRAWRDAKVGDSSSVLDAIEDCKTALADGRIVDAVERSAAATLYDVRYESEECEIYQNWTRRLLRAEQHWSNERILHVGDGFATISGGRHQLDEGDWSIGQHYLYTGPRDGRLLFKDAYALDELPGAER